MVLPAFQGKRSIFVSGFSCERTVLDRSVISIDMHYGAQSNIL